MEDQVIRNLLIERLCPDLTFQSVENAWIVLNSIVDNDNYLAVSYTVFPFYQM